MGLREYEELKFELSAILRGLGRQVAAARPAHAEGLRELFGRLAADRFNLAVVGRFSRGKTSLMNALLGSNRLPTGVVPLTSVITLVTYGSEEKVVLHYYGSTLFMDVRLSQLSDFITERGNPGNRRGISAAEVQLPAELLRRGFTFVDTPGIGSSIAANTRTTEAFLPQADALILVSSYDSPLSAEEAALVAHARSAGRRIFLVLNKQDLADEAARADALAYVQRELARFDAADTAVFSVSASEALAAKQARDARSLDASGLPALKAAIIDFLIRDRRRVFLSGMCDRIAALADTAEGGAIRDRLAALRQRIVAGGPAAPPARETTMAARCRRCWRIASCARGWRMRCSPSSPAIRRGSTPAPTRVPTWRRAAAVPAARTPVRGDRRKPRGRHGARPGADAPGRCAAPDRGR